MYSLFNYVPSNHIKSKHTIFNKPVLNGKCSKNTIWCKSNRKIQFGANQIARKAHDGRGGFYHLDRATEIAYVQNDGVLKCHIYFKSILQIHWIRDIVHNIDDSFTILASSNI